MSADVGRVSAAGGRRPLLLMLLAVFISIAGFGVVIPLLPFYAETFGIPTWKVGALFAAFSLGQFVGEPFWGRLSDRWGRRPVLLLTMLGGFLSYLLLAMAPSYWVAFGARLFGGFAAGNIATIQAYVSDTTPPRDRVKRLGMIGAVFGLGFVIGPAVGGVLADPAAGAAGFRPPLLAAAALSLASAAGIFLFVPETNHVARTGHASGVGLREAWGDIAIRRILLTTMIATGAFSAMEGVFGLWANVRFGWGAREVGWLFAFVGIMSAFCQFLVVGPMSRLLGETRMLMLGFLLTAAGLLTTMLAPAGWVVVAATALNVFGMALVNPAIASMLTHCAPPDRQGGVLGINSGAGALARIGGPLIAGVLFDIHIGAPYLFAAIGTLPAILLGKLAGDAVARRPHFHEPQGG